MKNFSQEKNGYNKREIEMYINNLEKEVNSNTLKLKALEEQNSILTKKLDFYKEKENIINKSIQSAVEAGEIIKQKNKNLLKNEIDQLKILYGKWSIFLIELKRQYPNATINQQSNLILQSLSEAIDNILQSEKVNKTNIDTFQKGCNDLKKYQKTIISNQNSGAKNNFNNVIVRNKKPSAKILMEDNIEKEFEKENKRLQNSLLQKQNNNLNNKIEKENFDDNFDNNSFSNNTSIIDNQNLKIKKDNGFNLKEAVNPTMDLEEIMKSFDLD